MEDRFTLIERYFKNELTNDELTDFKNKLVSDSELADEVNSYQTTKSTIDILSIDRMKKRLNKIGHEIYDTKSEGKKKAFPMYFNYSIAAAILVFILAGIY